MLFAPHAGRPPAKAGSQPSVAVTQVNVATSHVPEITITTTFRLPPHLAFEMLIQEAAAQYQMDPAVVRAVIRAESGFDPLAVSTAGAQGLMQLMPDLSEELGVTDPFDPRENIFAGTRYLAWLLDMHNGDEALALASYNAGPGAVAQYSGVPPYPETQHYVRSISAQLARERAVAATPTPTPSPE